MLGSEIARISDSISRSPCSSSYNRVKVFVVDFSEERGLSEGAALITAGDRGKQ